MSGPAERWCRNKTDDIFQTGERSFGAPRPSRQVRVGIGKDGVIAHQGCLYYIHDLHKGVRGIFESLTTFVVCSFSQVTCLMFCGERGVTPWI